MRSNQESIIWFTLRKCLDFSIMHSIPTQLTNKNKSFDVLKCDVFFAIAVGNGTKLAEKEWK